MSNEIKYVPPPGSDTASDAKLVPTTDFVGVGRSRKTRHAASAAKSGCAVCVFAAALTAIVLLVVLACVYMDGTHQVIEGEIQRLEESVEANQMSIKEMQKDPCLQPKEVGPCEAAVPRWHYDPVKGQCSQFMYGGCQGNENNFVTLTSCARRCEKDDHVEQKPQIKVEERHMGSEEVNENVVEPEPVDEKEEDPCVLEPSAGPCRALLPRFYFDREEGNCKKFLYGGCSGNVNNFMTEVECLNRCGKDLGLDVKPKSKEEKSKRRSFCNQPSGEIGLCRALVERWTFNADKAECELFYWGGCGGNENNFVSKEKCDMACELLDKDGQEDETPASAFNAPVDRCGLPKEIGPCRAAIPRFFYNLQSERCESFTFGGCDGNGNNFDSEEECQRHCTEEGDN